MIVSLFNDVIGPAMRGPSSSHCAAALRIGRLARDLMDGDFDDVLVEFDRGGSLPTTHDSQGSDMGLFAGLMGWEAADERLPGSMETLAQSGVRIRIETVDFGDPHLCDSTDGGQKRHGRHRRDAHCRHLRRPAGSGHRDGGTTRARRGGNGARHPRQRAHRRVFIATAWTFAAEVGGCQAEGGSAAAMAAAGLITLAGGSRDQAVAAASMAMQSMLGLICDPIANRVEAPCLGKNVMAAANALSCANMALAGFDPLIPLDETIAATKAVATQMPRELRCTALGGLSITPTSLAIEHRLAGRKAACGAAKCGCG